jgi:hypothetical protein
MARQSGRSSSRSSGFGGRSSSSNSRSASPNYSSNTRTQQPTYKAQTATPVPQTTGGGMMGGLGSTIMTGMAFGAGSEIAHQAVRSVMGGGSSQHTPSEVRPEQSGQPMEYQNQNNVQNQQKTTPCNEYNFKFVECLKGNDNNISTCQTFFDDLKSCEKSLI